MDSNKPLSENVDEFVGYLKEAEAVSNELIGLTGDKDAAQSAEAVEKLVNLAARLAAASLKAYSVASGQPINHDTIIALLPADIPLVDPDPQPGGTPPPSTT